MRAALAELSRDDALFFCARINAIVSGFSPNRSIVARQQRVLSWLCTPAEIGGRRTLPATLSNGMDAPTLNGINVPKWMCLATTKTDRSVRHEDYNGRD